MALVASLPAPKPEIHEIWQFALTYDGSIGAGSFEACADMANASLERYRRSRALPEGLTELRTCLLFEQRRWRHFGQDPEGEDLEYVHDLVDAIS